MNLIYSATPNKNENIQNPVQYETQQIMENPQNHNYNLESRVR